MKFIPILFNTEMVQGIIDDRKTQTRRSNGLEKVNKRANDWSVLPGPCASDGNFVFTAEHGAPEQIRAKCRYGEPGDVLWVKETFYAFGHWITEEDSAGVTSFHFVDETRLHGMEYRYFDNPPEKVAKKRIQGSCNWYKRPSIFMPKAAARLFLQNTKLRPQQLNDISEEDAIAEGIKRFSKSPIYGWQDYLYPDQFCLSAKDSFLTLFSSIYGAKVTDANPWQWVVEFKRIPEPVTFNLTGGGQ